MLSYAVYRLLEFYKLFWLCSPRRRFSENTVAQMWYFVKCVYFGLSAYQIRCGYPTRVLGNFLTKSHNYVNLFLFQGWVLGQTGRRCPIRGWEPAAVTRMEGDGEYLLLFIYLLDIYFGNLLLYRSVKSPICWLCTILYKLCTISNI